MTISKHKLMQFRKEALKTLLDNSANSANSVSFQIKTQAEVILILTQALIDQHLLTEFNKENKL